MRLPRQIGTLAFDTGPNGGRALDALRGYTDTRFRYYSYVSLVGEPDGRPIILPTPKGVSHSEELCRQRPSTVTAFTMRPRDVASVSGQSAGYTASRLNRSTSGIDEV